MRGIPLGQSWMANYFSVLIFAQKCAIYLPAKQFILFRVYLILRSAVQICKWIGAMYLGHSDARCVGKAAANVDHLKAHAAKERWPEKKTSNCDVLVL